MGYTKEEVKARLNLPNGVESAAAEIADSFEGAWQLFLEQDAAAAGLLARIAKQKIWAAEIHRRLGDRAVLHAALRADHYKLRKNAARLAGALHHPDDAAVLAEALLHETTRMVRPSQILALGAMGLPEAGHCLETYQIVPPADESEKRHYEDEKAALAKARAAYQVLKKHDFTDLKAPRTAELACPAGLADALAASLEKTGISVQKKRKNGVRVRLAALQALQQVRGWQEVLFPMVTEEAYSVDSVVRVCEKKVLPFLTETHRGELPFAYRWELRGVQDRGRLARSLSTALEGKGFINNPAGYEIELRLTMRGNQYRLDIKLFTAEDLRFSYRKKDVPASIHPATAAGVMELVYPWLREDALVADPCCGSGTMLLERREKMPCKGLIGVDISRSAIDAARENFRAAGRSGRFLVKDCTQWMPPEPLDEIISNLPFGNRVGTHSGNERLYKELVHRLPQWLRPGGVAILYTMEIALLHQLTEENERLELKQIFRTEAGGLCPAVFVIQNKKVGRRPTLEEPSVLPN